MSMDFNDIEDDGFVTDTRDLTGSIKQAADRDQTTGQAN